MIINKNRLINYFIAIFFLSILVINTPISQPLKYIFFILCNFIFIVSSYKKINFLRKNFILSILFFSLVTIFINYSSTTFKIEINSFGNTNLDSVDKKAVDFYQDNYSECLDEKICFGENNYNIIFKNIFHRNNLNIKNLNELRTNIFTSPGTTLNNSPYVQHYNYPYLIKLHFPKFFFGSELCYDTFESKSNCYNISDTQFNFTIIGAGEDNNITLDESLLVKIYNLVISLFYLSIFFIIINNIYKIKIRNNFELFYPASFILWLIIFSMTNNNNINFLNSYFFQYPGGDGYWYLFLGNLISENIKQFNIIEALRGGKDIYYFMPGMRYFVGIEKLIYGNAYYLHLIILGFLPFTLKKLLELYLSTKIIKYLMLSFLFIPLMHHMGFSYYQFIRYTSKVFAEPIAYTIFIFAFTRLVMFYKNRHIYISSLPFTCLLLNISCILRPNLSSSSFFLLLFPFLYVIFKKRVKILIPFSICGSIIFLPFLHNYYFGNEFVLFTSAVFTEANIKITLNDYFIYLTTFDLIEEKKIMILEIIKNFFNPYEIHKYFILFGLIYSLKYENLKNNLLLPMYILIFSQFYLFLFLNPGPRYIWIFWLASLILSLNTFAKLRYFKK